MELGSPLVGLGEMFCSETGKGIGRKVRKGLVKRGNRKGGGVKGKATQNTKC